MKFNRYIRLTSFENALVLTFLLIMASLLLGYYKKYEAVVKSRVAYEQLYQINTAIMLYTVLKGQFPEDLKVLTSEGMLTKGESPVLKKRYIEGLSVDKDGYPLDPWGRRYRYDRKRGLAYLEK
ncbi:MAG: hypothetical protein OHK0040_14250 [bacterium]